MNRRALLTTMGFAILGVPLIADAQRAAGIPRIGFLLRISPLAAARALEAFRDGLHRLGWTEGRP
jgi:hypothetical protein